MNHEDSWTRAIDHYRAGVKNSLLAEYRCRPGGCMLLRVWQSPNGPEFFAPAAGVSDQYTSAGQWHWLGFNRQAVNKTGDRAGRLDDLAKLQAGGWLWLLCDHVKLAEWVRDLRQDIEGRTPGRPVRVMLPRGHADPG